MFSEIRTKKCRLRVNDEFSAISDTFYRLDEYIAKCRLQTYKNKPGDGTSVYLVDIHGKKFIIKRYNASTLKLAIKRVLFGNKAFTSWQSAILLRENNIATIKPVAAIQHYKFRLRSHAFFVSEYIEGMTARKYFAEDSSMKKYWQQAIEKIHTLTKQLKSLRFVHDDYHCANILMVDHEPYLLDLDHVRQFPTVSKEFIDEHEYDIEHFHRLLKYNPTVQAMFREQIVANSKT